MGARLFTICGGVALLCVAPAARADGATPPASPVDVATRAALETVARTLPFQPKVILCPPMHIVRPSDIPVPKPTKGLGLSFQW